MDVVHNPKTVVELLPWGGTSYRLPNGMGFVIEKDGKFNVLDPSWFNL